MPLSPDLDFLVTFAVVLIAAEVGSIVFHRLRLPRVVGMLVAGVLIGPATNPFSAAINLDPARISDLAFLGGIFLMFSIGLSFDVRSLRTTGVRGLSVGLAGAGFSFLAGFAVATAFDQGLHVALLVGLLLTPTSTTIALRLTQEQNLLAVRGIDTTVSSIVLDDVITLFFATIVLAVIATGTETAWGTTFLGIFLIVAMAAVIVFLAFHALPRTLKLSARLSGGNPTLLAVSLGFMVALAFTLIGLPPLFGAFWAGAVIATAPLGRNIRTLTQPVTDIFSAVFFTAIGMLLDPWAFPALSGLVLAIVAVAIAAKFVGGFLSLSAFGTPAAPAAVCAVLLVPRGEVGLVIAQFAHDPAVQAKLQLLAAALMIVTALATPLAINGLRAFLRRRARAAAPAPPGTP